MVYQCLVSGREDLVEEKLLERLYRYLNAVVYILVWDCAVMVMDVPPATDLSGVVKNPIAASDSASNYKGWMDGTTYILRHSSVTSIAWIRARRPEWY